LEEESRRDYKLAEENDALGPLVSGSLDQRLTLMEEVVLLGLKDQQGYLSFLNDSISYVLRGCILMELALRRRIRVLREPGVRQPFPERIVEVVDGAPTGEVLLDETIRLLKQEKNSISSWMDLLSGETWNPLKVGYQLKQVRERIAKGLVDKGVLRTEKHSFILFDMATHPLANGATKEDVMRRGIATCLGRGPVPTLRAVALVAAALTANVLERALNTLPYAERDAAFGRAEELLKAYGAPAERNVPLPPANEIIAGVLTVFSRLDSLIY
jgi:Golgi phosphoprotein 3